MLQPLALELYQLIIAHVDDTTTLLSLALCCSAFRDEAQRCLFRHVDAKWPHRDTLFVAAINASPLRLGPLVHALDFQPRYGLDMMDRSWTVPLSLALRAMHNLKHLAFDRVNPSIVLQDCTFELQTLYYGRVAYTSQVMFLLCDFLPTHPSIKRLQCTHTAVFDAAEVPTGLCPNLDFLGVGDDHLLGTLLRDTRLITRFAWHSSGFPTMTIPQLNHLQYLMLIIRNPDMDTSFTFKLTSLVHLELRVHLRPPGALSRKLQFLHNIPRLEVLVFQIDGRFLEGALKGAKLGNKYHLRHIFTTAYQHAFELCPTLKHIDAGQVSNPIYNRFFRPSNGENGVLVSNRLVHAREVLEWRLFV